MFSTLLNILLLPLSVSAILIAADINSIEHTPHIFAISDHYTGTASLISGGIASLWSNPNVTLATNAETQALRQYAQHKNLRIIFTSAETYYHIVANRHAGIETLEDLKGKRIGVIPGTSANYFVQKYLGMAGLKEGDYSTVAGQICMRAPCGPGTFPYLFTQERIDAVAMWEPSTELARLALGVNNTITFTPDESVYREIVNVHSTVEKLADPETRKEIVAYVAALIKTHKWFREEPEEVIGKIVTALRIDRTVLENVWAEHKWRGGLAEGLDEVLIEEEEWVRSFDRRAATSQEDLAKMVDRSVLEEAVLMLNFDDCRFESEP
ncbi:periplasmic binding protein-like II [Ascobolus immersus RN42]|uniref:Periplasmic binding protein-like II n=1 Tax=Ascobolus immersus RN42 TaxID=1160509 RepID=A0A3N4HUZ2_ASCIM|nr:periplasmic binding protein-like II [Ascobolus immersus RN42]